VDLHVPDDAELAAAERRLRGRVRRTPVVQVAPRDLGTRGPVSFKLEQLQYTGAFKARGALNSVLSMPPTSSGEVVAASGGNHGAAVAWAAREAGVRATIFVPASAPAVKQDAIRDYGADLRLVDGFYADALVASREFAAATGAAHIDAYDDPATVAGQSTLGAELATQIPAGDVVIVPCGGGGLFAGVTLALRRRNRVVAAEPEVAATLASSIAAGHQVDVEVGGVAVDSLGARRVGGIALAVALANDSRVLLVPDDGIRAARARLWDTLRIAAEPGGATALAALLRHRDEMPETGVTVVISGANA
jgi:threonine dehydratase